MKQHITGQQLLEVDMSKLANLTKNDEVIYDDLCHYAYAFDEEREEQKLAYKIGKHFTIGKMIQIIEDSWQKDEIFITREEDFNWFICFDLQIDYDPNPNNPIELAYQKRYRNSELCNALWEAVKELL